MSTGVTIKESPLKMPHKFLAINYPKPSWVPTILNFWPKKLVLLLRQIFPFVRVWNSSITSHSHACSFWTSRTGVSFSYVQRRNISRRAAHTVKKLHNLISIRLYKYPVSRADLQGQEGKGLSSLFQSATGSRSSTGRAAMPIVVLSHKDEGSQPPLLWPVSD